MKKVVLVTGSSRGLGKVLAEKLSLKGSIVYAGIRDKNQLPLLQQIWQKDFPGIKPLKLDVTAGEDCRLAIAEIVKNEGRIDLLINAAALVIAGPGQDFSAEDYLKILDTNAVGPFRLIKEVLPLMVGQKGGQIINITSLNGLVSLPNFSLYSSSKFALEALGMALRTELRGQGIWITNVEPGAFSKPDELGKPLVHKSAREKFWLLRKLLPISKLEDVVESIEEIIDNPKPPARFLLGRDTRLIFLLQRFLPQSLWDRLLFFIWKR